MINNVETLQKREAQSETLPQPFLKDSTWKWPLSGNLDADSCGTNGNVRLIHVDSKIGDDTVVFLNTPFRRWSFSSPCTGSFPGLSFSSRQPCTSLGRKLPRPRKG
jgi:hypothetical protein